MVFFSAIAFDSLLIEGCPEFSLWF